MLFAFDRPKIKGVDVVDGRRNIQRIEFRLDFGHIDIAKLIERGGGGEDVILLQRVAGTGLTAYAQTLRL